MICVDTTVLIDEFRAKSHGARLPTRNPKHFQAVEGLDIIGY